MNYKELDQKNYIIIQGLYDKYGYSYGESKRIFEKALDDEFLMRTIEEFEVLMSVYDQKDKLANDNIRLLNILTEKDYNKKLYNLFRTLNTFSYEYQINSIERYFIGACIFQHFSKYLQFNDEDEILNEPDDYDQTPLGNVLHIIFNCVKRSDKLCYNIIKNGVLHLIKCNFDYYNKFSRYISYSIFSEVFNKQINFGQLGYRDFIIDLAKRHLTEDGYNKDPIEASQVSQLLFSFNSYGILHDETMDEKKLRQYISGKAFLIINNNFGNCINSALKGINDLIIYCEWYTSENPDLIIQFLEYLSVQTDEDRISYVIKILGSLYESLNKFQDKNTEFFKEHQKKFFDATQANINVILNLITFTNVDIYTIKLYSIIIETLPDLLLCFANESFLGYLYDYLDDGKYELKMEILFFIDRSLKIENSDFINFFFSHMIGKLYICSLSLIDSDNIDLKLLLHGLLIAFDINSDLINNVLHNCDDFEDLRSIDPIDEEEDFLLNNIFERYDSYKD